MQLNNQQQRFVSMDVLRAAAMIWGIFYHGLFSFAPVEAQNWFVQDIAQTSWVDSLLFISHIIRMPLFFIIAGFFAVHLIQKRGIKFFFKNRLKRIAAPFSLFFVLLLPAWMFLVFFAAKTSSDPTLLVQGTMAKKANAIPSISQLPIGHLWFLNYLFIISILFISLVFTTKPMISSIQKIICHFANRPMLFVIFSSCLLAGLLSLSPHLRVGTPPKGLVPELWSLAYYTVTFFVGVWLYGFKESISHLASRKLLSGGLISAVCATFIFLNPAVLGLMPWLKPIAYVCYTFAALSLSLVIIGYCWSRITKISATTKYFCDASYWMYIIHVPLMIFIQIKCQSLALNGLIKYALIVSTTLLISLLSYHLLVRYTPIGWMLNGRRQKLQVLPVLTNPVS